MPNDRTIGVKKRPAKKPARLPKTPQQTLVAFQIHEDDSAPIRPARRERRWMDETAFGKFAYRCLPLVIANQYGWEILSTHHIRASWNGSSGREGVVIENLSGDGPLQTHAHFGLGVITFQIPFLFQTPPGWNLMVRGPMNRPKDGIVGLDGVVEADWSHATFTMNWRFTRACTVEFVIGEPICHIFPIQRGTVESFQTELRMLESEPELNEKFREWSQSRDSFLWALAKQKPDIVAQGWQKDYLNAARDKKLLAGEFVDKRAPAPGNGSDSNHKER
ncbi:MAG TPA: DUF6065 family protein [Chthoniobacterales bacterium]|nr:DUF6065 family protein [Chthoniobacterales bacterium]